jgi:hypothetical protein
MTIGRFTGGLAIQRFGGVGPESGRRADLRRYHRPLPCQFNLHGVSWRLTERHRAE